MMAPDSELSSGQPNRYLLPRSPPPWSGLEHDSEKRRRPSERQIRRRKFGPNDRDLAIGQGQGAIGMSQTVRIALDAMGGDHGPAVVVAGAELALARHRDSEFLFLR